VKFVRTALPEVIRVQPDVHGDARGYFLETWHAGKYAEGGIDAAFAQDNHSRSQRGILRGLHAQLDPPQGKLVRCVAGEIWDVAVDARPASPTFGQHVAVTLTGENHEQLWVPAGFLHGFLVLSETADVAYKCTSLYRPEGEIAVAWDDPALAIPWPIDAPSLSGRDAEAPPLSHFEARLRAR